MQTNKRMLKWLYIYPLKETTATKKRLMYAAFTTVVLAISIAYFLSNLVFFFTYVASDLEKALFAVWQIGGSASVCNHKIVHFLICFFLCSYAIFVVSSVLTRKLHDPYGHV